MNKLNLIAVVLGAASTLATAQTAQPAQQAPAQQVNSIVQAAAAQGVRRCAGRIGQFTDFLLAGSQAGAQMFASPNPAAADKSIASLSMEIQAGGVLSYASASFAPDAETGQCSGVYDAVVYWPKSCADVYRDTFPTYRPIAALRQSITTLDGGATVRAYLMPAGAGCVSIKKEVTF